MVWGRTTDYPKGRVLRVHLVNPSHVSFGVGVITPRWLYVLAAATPSRFGDPVIVDETLEVLDPSTIQPGDVVGIGIHTGNALRGYEVGNARPRARRAGRLRRHPRHAVSRRSRTSSAARTRSCAAMATSSGRGVVEDVVAGRHAARLRGGRVDGGFVPAGALGSAAGRSLHVGVGADRARLSEALLVLFGVAHRRPEAAPARQSTRSSARSSSCAATASASSRSPTTTSIR